MKQLYLLLPWNWGLLCDVAQNHNRVPWPAVSNVWSFFWSKGVSPSFSSNLVISLFIQVRRPRTMPWHLLYPIPRVEDLLATFSKGMYFTKRDLSQTYLQFPLDKQSRKYVGTCTRCVNSDSFVPRPSCIYICFILMIVLVWYLGGSCDPSRCSFGVSCFIQSMWSQIPKRDFSIIHVPIFLIVLPQPLVYSNG